MTLFDPSTLIFVETLETGIHIFKTKVFNNRYKYYVKENDHYLLIYDQTLCSLQEIQAVLKDCYNEKN